MNTKYSILNSKETAELLNVSVSSIYRWIRSLVLPCYRIGGRLLFDKEEILDWFKNKKIKNQFVTRIYNRDLQNLLTKDSQTRIEEVKGDEMARSKRSRRNYGYGSVYVRMTSDGIPRFYKDRYDKSGKRIQKLVDHATSWDEAHEDLKADVLKEHYDERRPQKKKIGFRSWSKVYQRDYSSFNKSWKQVEYMMKPLTEFFKDTELRQIVPSDIQRFIKSRQKIGNSPATLNRYISLVKRMMNVAIEEGYLEDNPVKIKKFSEQDREKTRVISEQEEEAILKNSNPQLRSFLTIAMNTGMRAGEIYRLSWKQINLRDRMITVEMTKSGKVRRVPINERLFQELVRMRSVNAKSQYLFYNPKTGRPITSMKKAFAGALNRAGLSGIRIHDFRHTAASRMIQAGVDVETLRSILGHSDISITSKYLHTNVEAKRKAVKMLESRPICYTTVTREKGERPAQLQGPFFSVN